MAQHWALITASVVAVLLWRAAREILMFWKRHQAVKHLPGPRLGLLGVFSLLMETRAHHRLYEQWTEKYGSLFCMRFLTYHTIVCTDPFVASKLLVHKRDHVDVFPFIAGPIEAWLGGRCLLSSPMDAQWKAIRKSIAPAFSIPKLRQTAPSIAQLASNLVAALHELSEGATLDVEKLMLLATLDMTGQFAFEQDLQNIKRFHDLVKDGRKAHDQLLSGTLAELLIDCTKDVDLNFRIIGWQQRFWRKDVQASQQHYKAWRAVQKEILSKDDASPSSEGSLLALLKGTKDLKSGGLLRGRRLLAESSFQLFAGSDSAAHQIAWALYFLSQHPDADRRIQEELSHLRQDNAVQSNSKAWISYEDLAQLPFLQAVIKETMRLMPAVGPGQCVITTKPIQLTEGLSVPPGVLITVPHLPLHTSTALWENAKEFIPERWLKPGQEYYTKPVDSTTEASEPNSKQKQDISLGSEAGTQTRIYKTLKHGLNGKADNVSKGVNLGQAESEPLVRAKRYTPFSEGPRDCAGKEFAKLMMPIVLATILRDFSFTLAPEMGGPEGVRAVEVSSLVTGTANGLLMQIHKRETPHVYA